MLLTALSSGMSPTFEYLRTHRFVNKDSYLKLVAVVSSEGEEQCTAERRTANCDSCRPKSQHSKQYQVIDRTVASDGPLV